MLGVLTFTLNEYLTVYSIKATIFLTNSGIYYCYISCHMWHIFRVIWNFMFWNFKILYITRLYLHDKMIK